MHHRRKSLSSNDRLVNCVELTNNIKFIDYSEKCI